MADNLVLNAGSGGSTLKTYEDSGSAHWQAVVLALNTTVGDPDTLAPVSNSAPVPVSDAGGALTVDNGGTFVVQVDGDALTALQLIDNIVAVVDAAAGSTPSGVPPLAVRDDALSALTPVEGDFVPLRTDANGALWVTPTTTPLPTDAATETKQDSIISLLAALDYVMADDSAWINSSPVGVVGYRLNDSTPDALDEGDVGYGRVTSFRAQHVVIRDNAGNERGLNIDTNGALAIGSIVPATNSTALGKAVDNAAGSTDTGVAALVVRDDSLTTLTPVDGDYTFIRTDSVGRTWTHDPVCEALLTTIDADTSTINTNVATLAGAVSGTEMQVDVVAPLPAGTNAIGKLAANSGVDIGDVDVTSQPARDRLTDNIGVALQTDVILSDTTALTPKFAAIDAATSGDNTLLAAVADKKIRVLALFLVAAGTVNARFESGAAGTALTGQMNLVANSGFTLPFNPAGWFETGSNTLLNLELSAAVSVDGCFTYIEV